LLGYDTFADYKLCRTMAQTPERVYSLLNQLRDAYRPAQQREFRDLEEFASETEGHPVKLAAWDYSYYANKLKQAKYAYDEEALRPYFELGRVTEGIFGLATRLYGLHFTETTEVDRYHKDVKTYVVTDSNDEYVGLLYTDFFPRNSKSPGAWMTGFSDEYVDADGVGHRPHVSIVMNFTKPTEDRPSLLTPGEVQTFLHEFGHALHGLLAKTRYASMSGTSVYRDFVELPSQFNENYLLEPEFLDSFACHYQTGEPLPQKYVERIVSAMRFGAGYACMRQLTFGYLDMAWHTIKASVADAAEFEDAATSDLAMFDKVDGAMISPQFGHIFSGGYASGYYSYKWAEVLDADAFAAFKEHGIFDKETAD
ncbi:MAG: peptidase M3, partial [Muribaculaceae bacterium]|nr:peptidase M3 [Muribaculaceae bacterium]